MRTDVDLSSHQPNHHTGSRRLTLTMLTARDSADSFKGLPAGSAKPLRLLAAFQEAEPYLGLPVHAFKLVSWLVKMTKPCDWEAGSRPIAWPSARQQQEFLGLTASGVKYLNRTLFEADIFVIRDNEQGKRYGRRGPDGRIVEAYGFDLSPLALRHDEFVRIAGEARAERKRMGELRRRATIARRGVRAAGEALEALGPLPPEWPRLKAETADLTASVRRVARSDDLALIVKSLESRKAEAEQWLREAANPVETGPTGPENRPHTTTTDTDPNSLFTVEAAEVCSPEGQAPAPIDPPPLGGEVMASTPPAPQAPAPSPAPAEVSADELADLSPRLGQWVPATGRRVTWPDIAAAAGPLCTEIGIPHRLWVEACAQMGVPKAAIALAIVASKPEITIRKSYAAYFTGMIRRQEAGALNLERSLWKLRRDSWKGTRH